MKKKKRGGKKKIWREGGGGGGGGGGKVLMAWPLVEEHFFGFPKIIVVNVWYFDWMRQLKFKNVCTGLSVPKKM